MNRLFVRKSRGCTYIELMIVMTLLGVLAAIAIPNFLKFRTRARQAEAKANLAAWHTAERAYFQEKNKYTESVAEVGFSPERGNRYAYYFGYVRSCVTRTSAGESTVVPENNCIAVDQGQHPSAAPQPTVARIVTISFSGPNYPGLPGMNGCSGSQCNISGYAAGDIDNESAGIDTWWISTQSTPVLTPACGSDALAAVAGEPTLIKDDVTCN